MQLKEIIKHLEQLAPPVYQEAYDNAGLLVGNPNMDVKACLISLDCTEAIIDEAIAKGCNLIISHHPIIFAGLKRLNGKNYTERVVIKAIKNDISLYACHTNLDNMQHGVNAKIAEKLGLKDVSILKPSTNNLMKLYVYMPEQHLEAVQNAFFEVGAGQIGAYSECSFSVLGKGSFKPGIRAQPKVGTAGGKREVGSEVKLEIIYNKHLELNILSTLNNLTFYEEVAYEIIALHNTNNTIGSGIIGTLPQPLSPQEFLKMLKSTMNTQCVRYTPTMAQSISKVALCGGSGSFLLSHAKSAGADAYISADFKYHEFFDAENQILIADIGHYESEQFTSEIFYSYLQKKISNFALHLSTTNTNPIQYF